MEDGGGAPKRMAKELEVLEGLTKTLLNTISGSSRPEGRRQGSGDEIQALVRQVLKQHQATQEHTPPRLIASASYLHRACKAWSRFCSAAPSTVFGHLPLTAGLLGSCWAQNESRLAG